MCLVCGKINFLLSDCEQKLKFFLSFSYEVNKNTRCGNHNLNVCGRYWSKNKFLLPIINEFKKDISKEEKKPFFTLRCLAFPSVFEAIFNFYNRELFFVVNKNDSFYMWTISFFSLAKKKLPSKKCLQSYLPKSIFYVPMTKN